MCYVEVNSTVNKWPHQGGLWQWNGIYQYASDINRFEIQKGPRTFCSTVPFPILVRKFRKYALFLETMLKICYLQMDLWLQCIVIYSSHCEVLVWIITVYSIFFNCLFLLLEFVLIKYKRARIDSWSLLCHQEHAGAFYSFRLQFSIGSKFKDLLLLLKF